MLALFQEKKKYTLFKSILPSHDLHVCEDIRIDKSRRAFPKAYVHKMSSKLILFYP